MEGQNKHINVFERMNEMECASYRNPNLMQTYEVMWKALKKEIQYNQIK